MGRVTRTDCVGGMQSHTFESYDDFVKWSMKQDDAVPSPFEGECSYGEHSEEYTLTLNKHEVYTLRILLGHCLDAECSSINAKLDEMSDEDLGCDDYNRLYFQFINEDGDVDELHDGDKQVTVRFKG